MSGEWSLPDSVRRSRRAGADRRRRVQSIRRAHAPKPEYVPAPLDQRPHADEIAHWLQVLRNTQLLELGARAHALRLEKAPAHVSYIVDRNINYSNLCVTDCRFCAFYRRPKDDEAYVLSYEEIGAKIDEAKARGGVQILMQGGHNPYLPLDWYLGLLRYIKEHHPIHVHGFSASEIEMISEGLEAAGRRGAASAAPGGSGLDSGRRRGNPRGCACVM